MPTASSLSTSSPHFQHNPVSGADPDPFPAQTQNPLQCRNLSSADAISGADLSPMQTCTVFKAHSSTKGPSHHGLIALHPVPEIKGETCASPRVLSPDIPVKMTDPPYRGQAPVLPLSRCPAWLSLRWPWAWIGDLGHISDTQPPQSPDLVNPQGP